VGYYPELCGALALNDYYEGRNPIERHGGRISHQQQPQP